jgi:hypothetical protein
MTKANAERLAMSLLLLSGLGVSITLYLLVGAIRAI